MPTEQNLNKMEWYTITPCDDNKPLSVAYDRIDSINEKFKNKEFDFTIELVKDTVYWILNDRINELVAQYKLALENELWLIYDIDANIWKLMPLKNEAHTIVIPNNNWKLMHDFEDYPATKNTSFWEIVNLNDKIVSAEKFNCVALWDSMETSLAKSKMKTFLKKHLNLWYFIAQLVTDISTTSDTPNRVSRNQFISIASAFYAHQYLNNININHYNHINLFLGNYLPGYEKE